MLAAFRKDLSLISARSCSSTRLPAFNTRAALARLNRKEQQSRAGVRNRNIKNKPKDEAHA